MYLINMLLSVYNDFFTVFSSLFGSSIFFNGRNLLFFQNNMNFGLDFGSSFGSFFSGKSQNQDDPSGKSSENGPSKGETEETASESEETASESEETASKGVASNSLLKPPTRPTRDPAAPVSKEAPPRLIAHPNYKDAFYPENLPEIHEIQVAGLLKQKKAQFPRIEGYFTSALDVLGDSKQNTSHEKLRLKVAKDYVIKPDTYEIFSPSLSDNDEENKRVVSGYTIPSILVNGGLMVCMVLAPSYFKNDPVSFLNLLTQKTMDLHFKTRAWLEANFSDVLQSSFADTRQVLKEKKFTDAQINSQEQRFKDFVVWEIIAVTQQRGIFVNGVDFPFNSVLANGLCFQSLKYKTEILSQIFSFSDENSAQGFINEFVDTEIIQNETEIAQDETEIAQKNLQQNGVALSFRVFCKIFNPFFFKHCQENSVQGYLVSALRNHKEKGSNSASIAQDILSSEIYENSPFMVYPGLKIGLKLHKKKAILRRRENRGVNGKKNVQQGNRN